MESIIFSSDVIVDDSSILKNGELRFVVNKALASIKTSYTEDLQIKIVKGTGNFTDSEGVSIGTELAAAKSHTFYATKGSVVSIPNKYRLNSIVCSTNATMTINLDDLSYSGINTMILYGNPFGDVSAMKCASLISTIRLTGENFFGSLNKFTHLVELNIKSSSDKVTLNLSNLPSTLKTIVFQGSSRGVSGNLEDAVNVTDLWLKECSVTGSISNLNTNLIRLSVRSNLVTGAFSDIARYTSLTKLDISKTQVTGNLGDVPVNTCPNLSLLLLSDGVTYTQAQKDAFLNAHQYLNKIEGGTLIDSV